MSVTLYVPSVMSTERIVCTLPRESTKPLQAEPGVGEAIKQSHEKVRLPGKSRSELSEASNVRDSPLERERASPPRTLATTPPRATCSVNEEEACNVMFLLFSFFTTREAVALNV